MSNPTNQEQPLTSKDPLSSMLGSAVGHSNQTSKGKLQPSQVSTPKRKLFKKSEVVSTSKERNFFFYWDESCLETSQWLSLPIKIDSQGLDLTSSNGSVTRITANSWFSTSQTLVQNEKWLKIFSPYSTALAADSTDSESTKLKSKKIKVYPSRELNQVWRKWLAAVRFCYNQAISHQRLNGKTSKLSLRNAIMQSDLPDWVKDTPCHIRQNAVFDAHLAFSASKDAKFRSVRSYSQSIKFNASNFSKGTWYSTLTKGLTFNSSETIPECHSGTQLVFCKGRWFAVFPVESAVKDNYSSSVIALDPGIRTFMTGFDSQKFLEFGNGDMGRITRLCQHLDGLMGKIVKAPNGKKRPMRKAAQRLRNKIKNLVNECHKKVACFLTKNYRVIFLPKFETSQMVARAGRKLSSKTARKMLTWAHYRFKMELKHQASLRNCQVVDVTEEYTSKTCTKCGKIHPTLGGSKIFSCKSCGNTLPRDFNGALGIMLKALRDTSSVVFNGDSAIVKLSGNALESPA